MLSRIFCRNTDVQERNEGNPFKSQVQGRQDSTTEPQSCGSKKRILQEIVDSVGSSQSKYQRFEVYTEESYKRWALPPWLATYLNKYLKFHFRKIS